MNRGTRPQPAKTAAIPSLAAGHWWIAEVCTVPGTLAFTGESEGPPRVYIFFKGGVGGLATATLHPAGGALGYRLGGLCLQTPQGLVVSLKSHHPFTIVQ